MHDVRQAPFPARRRQQAFDDPFVRHEPPPHGAESLLPPPPPVLVQAFDDAVEGLGIGIQLRQFPAVPAHQDRRQGRPRQTSVGGIGHRPEDPLHFFGFQGGEDAAIGDINAADAATGQRRLDDPALFPGADQHGDVPGLERFVADGDQPAFPGGQKPGDLPGRCRQGELLGLRHL